MASTVTLASQLAVPRTLSKHRQSRARMTVLCLEGSTKQETMEILYYAAPIDIFNFFRGESATRMKLFMTVTVVVTAPKADILSYFQKLDVTY